MDLDGKHVAITGGSRGIGAAMGRAFAAAGANVTLVARGESALQEVAGSIGARAVVADVERPAGLVARLEQGSPIDVLVNNAGLDAVGRFEDLTPEALRSLVAVNVLAPAELTRQALPAMMARGGGRVVFISSLSAQVALPGMTAYSATKAAVSQLAEGLRRDLRGTGVGVTVAELGPVSTAMYETVTSHPASGAAFRRMIRIGLLRVLSEEAVATTVVRACRRDRDRVVLPRRAAPSAGLSHLPQRLANPMMRGR